MTISIHGNKLSILINDIDKNLFYIRNIAPTVIAIEPQSGYFYDSHPLLKRNRVKMENKTNAPETILVILHMK